MPILHEECEDSEDSDISQSHDDTLYTKVLSFLNIFGKFRNFFFFFF